MAATKQSDRSVDAVNAAGIVCGAFSIICFYAFVVSALDRLEEDAAWPVVFFLVSALLSVVGFACGIRSVLKPAGRYSILCGVAALLGSLWPWAHVIIARIS